MSKRWVSVLFLFWALTASSPVGHAIEVKPYQKDSAVTGILTSDPDCVVKEGRGTAQLWVSVGQILVYQLDVPPGGSYEFHLVPGKYDLAVTNSKGCLAQKQFTLAPKQVAKVNLHLTQKRGGS
ncbi:MAG TPA: hypothetical protein DCS07_16245 [Bdellovibrionales bacterium]|nr:MAG: hypothetical protein A2Z97_11410 [Bdellovibrionales bacterium GWB1_52_6]OFZ03862.1 MAG: hypothetical protein A2X97_15800 [Bdellovibrionales bacterium GWA1_52_35]OFZ33744.1 MAG: hypothetical protein A2070_00900 [Bdellovibrionales bacterium GWC1_52_8]HAR44155.1 hypothetical protein [Bdellovibrionales bacterium]HCM39703.1 hypothetical protein [Bdellovibrionales bacterium]